MGSKENRIQKGESGKIRIWKWKVRKNWNKVELRKTDNVMVSVIMTQYHV